MNWQTREDMNLHGLSTVSSPAGYLALESKNQPRQARTAFEEHGSELHIQPWTRQRNQSFPAKPRNPGGAKHKGVFLLGNSEGNYLYSIFYLLGTDCEAFWLSGFWVGPQLCLVKRPEAAAPQIPGQNNLGGLKLRYH